MRIESPSRQLADYFKRHPAADANRDGKLTRQEARSHRQGNPTRGDNTESNSRIPGIDVSPSDSPVGEIALHSPDGVDLSFAYRKPQGEGPFPTILFFHGGGDQSNLQGLKNNLLTSPIQTRFLARGYLTVQSTRRPFWKTPGGDTPTGFYEAVADATRVVNKVKTLPGADPDRIILYGGIHYEATRSNFSISLPFRLFCARMGVLNVNSISASRLAGDLNPRTIGRMPMRL